jgi:hypothetical protein
MRKLPYLLLCLLVPACGGGGPPQNFDAGPRDPDAGESPDAAPLIDAGPPPPDAGPPPPVTVRATRLGIAQAELPVLVHDPSGAFVLEAMTDEAGEATVEVPTGGMVTVIGGDSGGDFYPVTVVGVQPGEELRFAIRPAQDFQTTHNVTISVPSFGSGSQLVVHTGGGISSTSASTTSMTVPFYQSDADTRETYSIVSKILDSASAPLAWSLLADVPKSSTSVTLPTWRTDIETFSYSMSGLPAGAGETSVSLSQLVDHFWRDMHPVSGTPENGSLAVALPAIPTGEAISVLSYTNLPPTTGTASRGIGFVTRTAASARSASVDFSGDSLPLVTSAALELPAEAAPTISWAFEGSTANLDAVVAYVLAFRNGRMVEWYIVTPPDRSAPLTIPTFPGSLAELMPAAGDDVSLTILSMAVDEISGPAEFRADGAFWSRLIWDGAEEEEAPSFHGRMTYGDWLPE